MTPARGKILVKSIEVAETLNGGRILLSEAVRQAWTIGQVEVVAVGKPERCEREDECERSHIVITGYAPPPLDNGDQYWHPIDERIKPGAWVLTKPRTTVESGTDGLFFVGQDDIVAIFEP